MSKQLVLFSPPQIIDQLSCIQAELQESVKELAKAKKKYYDCEQVAHAVREKADIEAKWVHLYLYFYLGRGHLMLVMFVCIWTKFNEIKILP